MNRPTIGSDPAPGPLASPPGARRWSDLLPRLLSAIVMIVAALGTAVLGGGLFVLFWLCAAIAIVWEWQTLIGRAGAGPRFGIGAAALAIAVPLVAHGDGALGAVALVAGLAVTAAVAVAPLRAMAVGGLVYAAALALSVTLLRASEPDGFRAILWLFAVVWGTDIFAYFGGRLIGGAKLWPRLSPSKTWSGFLTGIGAGALLGLAVAPAGSNLPVLLAIGLAAGALAQGGDLFESSLKRRYGVKDASRLIPGHGGVMDRLDGFLVAAVFAALLGAVRAGAGAAGLGLFNW